MERKIKRLLLLSSISFLAACSHIAGNVIPESGPTMESIYDDWGDNHAPAKPDAVIFRGDNASSLNTDNLALSSGRVLSAGVESPAFSLLDNPPLKLYIFPHLAGSEELPIPGYWTAFSAYSRTRYALPLAIQSEERK